MDTKNTEMKELNYRLFRMNGRIESLDEKFITLASYTDSIAASVNSWVNHVELLVNKLDNFKLDRGKYIASKPLPSFIEFQNIENHKSNDEPSISH